MLGAKSALDKSRRRESRGPGRGVRPPTSAWGAASHLRGGPLAGCAGGGAAHPEPECGGGADFRPRRTLPAEGLSRGSRRAEEDAEDRARRRWMTTAWRSSAGAGRRSWRRPRRSGSGGGPRLPSGGRGGPKWPRGAASRPRGTWRWPRASWRVRGDPRRRGRPGPRGRTRRAVPAPLRLGRAPGAGSSWWISSSATW